MTAAVIAAIAIAVYLVVAAVYLAVSSQLISWDLEIDVTRVLRSRTPGGSGVAGQRPDPPGARSAVAGVERGGHPHSAAAPPAPCPLAGAAVIPSAAPARPPRRSTVLLMGEPACGFSWGDGCWFNGGGSHLCAWPASKCTGWSHKCGCGSGSSG